MEKIDLKTVMNSSNLSHEYGMPIFKQDSLYKGKEEMCKKIVLSYLKSFPPSWITSARVVDMITNQKIDKCNNSFSDGKYEWSEADIYHFEMYNMPLNEEFLNYVKTKF